MWSFDVMFETSNVYKKTLQKGNLSKYTLETHIGIGMFGLRLACLPSSICTEMLACDKSTPELCKACVSVSNNLSKYSTFTLI